MYVIGLTGGIASGKSSVSSLLKRLGAFIIDTDRIAREVVQPNQPAWHDIIATFGRKVLSTTGEIDRRALGELVFHDQEAKAKLEAITHPRIKESVLALL